MRYGVVSSIKLIDSKCLEKLHRQLANVRIIETDSGEQRSQAVIHHYTNFVHRSQAHRANVLRGFSRWTRYAGLKYV